MAVWPILFVAFFFKSGPTLTDHVFNALSTKRSPSINYKYFAIGSNMLPATMESLRGIAWEEATAGVLLDYRLAFDVPGNPLVEPSASSIRYAPGSQVHGVLYDLTPDQFATVGRTEGVPFGYQWEACHVVPYLGNGENAGARALLEQKSETTAVVAFGLTTRTGSRAAATKTAGRQRGTWMVSTRDSADIPTSPSYLRILQQGAEFWELDRSYQQSLSNVETAPNLIVPDGLAGYLLQTAELLNPPRSTRTRGRPDNRFNS